MKLFRYKRISKSFKNLKPDLVVILGDRYEIFSACCSAFINQSVVTCMEVS